MFILPKGVGENVVYLNPFHRSPRKLVIHLPTLMTEAGSTGATVTMIRHGKLIDAHGMSSL